MIRRLLVLCTIVALLWRSIPGLREWVVQRVSGAIATTLVPPPGESHPRPPVDTAGPSPIRDQNAVLLDRLRRAREGVR